MEAEPLSVPIEKLLAHATWVRGLALHLVRDPAAADDVVQSAWLAALRNPPREDRNLRAWLGRVVTNVARQRGRGAARRAERERAAWEKSEPADLIPDELAERVEIQRRLAAEVLELDEAFRQTLILRFYEGLSSAQIARRTGTPEGTVRWRLKRGLDALRERLDDDYGSRRTWCLALIPLARRAAPSELATLGTGTGLSLLLQGILAMNLGLKLALASAVLLGTFFLTPLHSIALELSPFGSRGTLAQEGVTFRPIDRVEAIQAPEGKGSARTEERVAVVPGEEAGLSSIVGRVIAPDGRPVAGAEVSLSGYEETLTTTDASGHFQLYAPKSWDFDRGYQAEVFVDAESYLVETVRCLPRLGEEVELGTIDLREAGAVEGQVVDAAGQPVAGAWVESGRARGSRDSLQGEALGRTLDGPRGSVWEEGAGPAVQTDAGGRFLLPRVPVGRRILWAGKEGHRAVHSGSVETKARQVTGGVSLQLGVLDPNDFIHGIVLDPSGEPLPKARLEIEFRSARSSGSATSAADGEGRFRLPYWPRTPHRILASNRSGRFASALLEDVVGGLEPVVLRLTEPAWAIVQVRGSGGPLSQGSLTAWDEEHLRPLVHSEQVVATEEGLRFPLPEEPFLLEVDREGFDLGIFGPFEGQDAPRKITVELKPLPGLRGRVMAEGQPVPGARLELRRRVEEQVTRNDFPVFLSPTPEVLGRTGEDGVFRLTLRESGTFYLRAEADGFAPSEVGPLDIEKSVGLSGVEVELGSGGAIEGLVLAEHGASRAGTIVAISRGDTHAESQRVGADGRFSFDHLIPGPWLVVESAEETTDSTTSWTSGGASFDPAFVRSNCVVEEGQVTRFELDLGGGEARPRVVGSLLLDGSAAEGWTAVLVPDGTMLFTSREGSQARVREDGSFELDATDPGLYRIFLRSPGADSGPGVVLSAAVDLVPGSNPWRASLRTGDVRIENPRGLDESGLPLDFLLLRTVAVDVMVPILAGPEGGPVTLTGIPVGNARVVRFTLQELVGLTGFPSEKEGLVDVTIRPGEIASVRIPE